MTEIMPEVIAGGYISPERVKAARDKEEQKRQAYGEAYAKKVIAEHPSLKGMYSYYVWEGKQRWDHKMFAPSKNEDYTSTFEYLDSKISKGMQEEFEEMWEETRKATVVAEPRHHRAERRPYAGCPDCPRWNGRKCVKPFDDETLCEEIDERFRERI